MRQAGILAAAGLFALEHNVSRLAEDHQNASYLAQKLSELKQLEEKVKVHTNMIFISAGIEGHDHMGRRCFKARHPSQCNEGRHGCGYFGIQRFLCLK